MVHLIAGVYDEDYGGDYDQEVHLTGDGMIDISNSTKTMRADSAAQ